LRRLQQHRPPAAKELGFSVTRVPAYSPYAVAEHAVALLLALNRKIPRANNRVHDLNFALNGLVGFDLHGKTAGIFGTGKIGRIAAQILRGFGMRVLAFDPFPSVEWAKQHGVEYTDRRTIARECEVISLHTPLTPETHHIIRSETLELIKPGDDPDQRQPRRAHRHQGAHRGAQIRPPRRRGA
jgi:D-lactate dehydrogenase